jgi:YD repeat-containing protein
MSCYISQGVSLNECSDSIGGIKKIYIAGGSGTTLGGVTGFTYDADDQITGATNAANTVFYGFELKRGTSSLTQNIQKSFENGTIYFDQELVAVMFKYDADKRLILQNLTQKDNLQIIGIDQNDTQYMLGQVRGMYTSAGAATTGLALGDRNGFEITFLGQEPVPARVIDGTLATVFSGATFVG